MRVILWGTYDTGKPRTRILHQGLRRNGVELEEIHADVWRGIEDKSQVTGRWQRAMIMMRWLLAYPRMIWRFVRAHRPDLVLVGYPGIVDVLLLYPFARLRGVPIAWDVFMSIHDTVCADRRLLKRDGLAARALWRLERTAINCVDLPFMDTRAHARRVEQLFELAAGRCDWVWVGVEVEHFSGGCPGKRPDSRMQVLFYGQFIGLHGIDTIVRAAGILRDEPIDWTLVGRGQEAARIKAMLVEHPLPNLRWLDWVEYHQLQQLLAQSDLCLGIFGTSGKAASVIPNKVFQIVAAGRPLLTRDCAAIRELLAPAEPCTYLVAPGDAGVLADAVSRHRRHLQDAPRQATRCHAGVAEIIDAAAIGRQFLDMARRRLDVS